MYIDGKLNHVVSRNSFSLVFGVGHSGIGQIKGMIQLFTRHWGVGRIDYYGLFSYFLQDAGSSIFVAFFFDVFEVFSLFFLVADAFFMRV